MDPIASSRIDQKQIYLVPWMADEGVDIPFLFDLYSIVGNQEVGTFVTFPRVAVLKWENDVVFDLMG